MFTVFNLLVVAFILLIAYWWGNQGLFSSILHFVAVVAAGAVAFAVWEPITFPLLKSGGFDVYAWGVTLIGVFAVMLVLFRKAFDRIAPGNVALPHWANLTFGGIVGLGSGTITAGILLIGVGHIQSHRALLGYVGTARSTQSGKVAELQTLWIPAHTITYDLYSYMSATSMVTAHPMRRYAPALDKQATLIRDSFSNGRGAITMSPEGASIRNAVLSPDGRKVYVAVEFNSKAIDFSDQLTLSQSQIRLIGDASGMEEAPTAVPSGWIQSTGAWPFESIGFYMTSPAGQESSSAVFEFNVSAGFTPEFIQIKGTRFELPRLEEGDAALASSGLTGGSTEELDLAAPNISTAFEVSSEIRPLYLGTNNLSGIKEDNLWLTVGDITQASSGNRPGKNLRIKGIYAPKGSQIVKVRIDPRSAANVFDKELWNQVEEGTEFKLVDARGQTYRPIGYFHKRSDNRYRIFLDPGGKVTSDVIPFIPNSGTEELRLIFRVTIGETIEGLKMGDLTVGVGSQFVEAESTVGR